MNTLFQIFNYLTELSTKDEKCRDMIDTLQRMQQYYNIPLNLSIPRTLIDCPVCHGNKVVSRIIDHEANGDSVWGEVRCYHCDGKGKVACN